MADVPSRWREQQVQRLRGRNQVGRFVVGDQRGSLREARQSRSQGQRMAESLDLVQDNGCT